MRVLFVGTSSHGLKSDVVFKLRSADEYVMLTSQFYGIS
jgi:hypothetical protein